MTDTGIMKKINEDELEKVSGGAIFYAGNVAGHNNGAPWEVINDSDRIIDGKKRGDVLGQFSSSDEAAEAARRYGLSDTEIGWNRVQDLRK